MVKTLPMCIIADELARMRAATPLVHLLTNEVVQELTANVLLALGASPAMVVEPTEAAQFSLLANAPAMQCPAILRAAQRGSSRVMVRCPMLTVACTAPGWCTTMTRRGCEGADSAGAGASWVGGQVANSASTRSRSIAPATSRVALAGQKCRACHARTSSAAIAARTMSRSIWPIGIQSRVAPRPAMTSPSIVAVVGGGTNR